MIESDPHSLATIRQRSRRHIQHLDFLADNYIDQALVKRALLEGLSQSETAKVLGMSKKTVNMHSRRPYIRYAVDTGQGADVADMDNAFNRQVWGSDSAAHAAYDVCRQYDRERLHLESP